MADTPNGETVVVEEPKNNAATIVNTVDTGEIERLKKEAEQATLRANQLANQLKAKEDAEAAFAADKLKEQNEYKTLYEQTQAKLAENQAAQEKAHKDSAIKAEAEKLFAEYPDEVRSLAQEVGLTLVDTDEDTTTAFKAKLEKISGSIKAPKVTANNPGVQANNTEMSPQDIHEIMKDPAKFQEYLNKNFKGIAGMTRKAE